MGEKELSDAEIETYRKEVAEIRDEAIHKELEEIKKERLRKELEEIKKERIQEEELPQQHKPVRRPTDNNLQRPLWTTTVIGIIACLMCSVATFILAMLYFSDRPTPIDDLAAKYGLPVNGTTILTAASIILAVAGLWIITTVKR